MYRCEASALWRRSHQQTVLFLIYINIYIYAGGVPEKREETKLNELYLLMFISQRNGNGMKWHVRQESHPSCWSVGFLQSPWSQCWWTRRPKIASASLTVFNKGYALYLLNCDFLVKGCWSQLPKKKLKKNLIKKNCDRSRITPSPPDTPGQSRLLCVFGAMFRCARTLPRMTACLHLHPSTCSCMSKDRSGCSPRTVKPSRKSLRILCHVFIRKIYGLILSTCLEDEVLCNCSCT